MVNRISDLLFSGDVDGLDKHPHASRSWSRRIHSDFEGYLPVQPAREQDKEILALFDQ